MNVEEIVPKLRESVKKVLENTGIFEIVSNYGLDDKYLKIKVRTKNKKEYFFLFDIKSIGQPRYARMGANQLKGMMSNKPKSYGIFGAPYLTERSMKICKDNGIGFIDLAGNCFIKVGDIYIDIQGKQNPYPNTRPLKSLLAQKSTRALRVLLCHPEKDWYVKKLAEEADISIGQASNIKQKLLDNEFVKIGKDKTFRLSRPESLLEEWASDYSYRKNKIQDYYSLDDVKNIEIKLANYCQSKNIQYAFTLTSGASLVSPSLRYNKVFAFSTVDIDEVAHNLGWKEVPSGANISILVPYDKGVLYEIQSVNGFKVVCDIQLYLDLKSYKERGEEAAIFLLENRIRKKW